MSSTAVERGRMQEARGGGGVGPASLAVDHCLCISCLRVNMYHAARGHRRDQLALRLVRGRCPLPSSQRTSAFAFSWHHRLLHLGQRNLPPRLGPWPVASACAVVNADGTSTAASVAPRVGGTGVCFRPRCDRTARCAAETQWPTMPPCRAVRVHHGRCITTGPAAGWDCIQAVVAPGAVAPDEVVGNNKMLYSNVRSILVQRRRPLACATMSPDPPPACCAMAAKRARRALQRARKGSHPLRATTPLPAS